jgi:hypothetical protein
LWVDHADELFRVLVDTQCYLLVLVVVDGVEVLEEELSENEVLIVEFVQLVLCNCKLAFGVGPIHLE